MADRTKESPFKTLDNRVRKEGLQPPYRYESDVLRAVKVAGAIERVLLVRGEPGTGKSTLARNVANALEWDYFETVVTSRTQARDLLWTFDHVERLNDAYSSVADDSRRVREKREYLEPGPLWRAFDPALAREVRRRPGSSLEPAVDREGAVVLIDEIDKADPDLPNDLLVPLEKKWFWVDSLDQHVKAQRPVFVVVSTNEERDLPPAFLRRSVPITLKRPTDRKVLEEIAAMHLTMLPALFGTVFDRYTAAGTRAADEDVRAPSTAEFLDALHACRELGISAPNHPELELVVEAALWKHDREART